MKKMKCLDCNEMFEADTPEAMMEKNASSLYE